MRILHTRFLLPFTFTVSTWFDISACANADVDAAIISNQRNLVQNVLDNDNNNFAHTLNYISRYDDDDNIPERNTWDMWAEDYYDQVSVEQALERTGDGDINHDAASSFSCKIKSDGRFGSVGGDDYFDVTYALQMTYHGGYWLAELFHHLNLKLGEKVVATLFPPCDDDDNDRRGRELSENLYSNTKLHQWELTHIAYSIAGMDVEMDYNEEGNCIDYVSHNEQYMCGVFTSSIRVFLVDDDSDDDRRNRKRRSMTATSDMVENVINVVVQDSISDVASNVKGIGELVSVDLEEYRAIKNKDDGVEDEDEDEDVAEKYENEILDGHKHEHEHEIKGEHNHEHEEEGQEHEGHYEEGKTHDHEHDHDDETDHDRDHNDDIKKTIAKSQQGPVDSKKSERLHAVGWTMIGLSVIVICAIVFRKYKNRNQFIKNLNSRSMQKRDLIMCESHPGTISDHSKRISGDSCDLEGNVLLDAVRDEERRGTRPDDRVEIIFDEGSLHSNCNEWHH